MCIFCKFTPAYKVYEDENFLAFLDINPIVSGHTLVIPKNHYANLTEVPDEDLGDLILIVKKIAALLMEKLNFTDYTISENNGSLSGQSIPHIHFHIIPRLADDNLSAWEHKEYKPGEAEEIIKKIKA